MNQTLKTLDQLREEVERFNWDYYLRGAHGYQPLAWPFDDDRLLHPSWDQTESEQPDTFPPELQLESRAPTMATASEMAVISIKDGRAKVKKSGHTLTEVGLDQLGSEPCLTC
jgi:hypothetical protein